MKIFLMCCILVSTILAAKVNAQQISTKANLHFSSINQVALLTGGSGQAAGVQTINGLTWCTYFAGIGTGIDYYGTRSIPLFLDVRKHFTTKPNSAFMYVDGGTNYPWITVAQKLNRFYLGTSSKGMYMDAGLGAKFSINNHKALLLSAGYSYKKVNDKTDLLTIWNGQNMEQTNEYYIYQYRRIVIKLGLEL